jgi:hypothetical protein
MCHFKYRWLDKMILKARDAVTGSIVPALDARVVEEDFFE